MWRSATEESRGDEGELSSPIYRQLVANRWRLGERLGSGRFGEVLAATDINTGESVAVKLETRSRRNSLDIENNVYNALQKSSPNVTGFAEKLFYSRNDECNVLVMTRLGHSLHHLLERCNGKFSATTILCIGIQVVTRIQKLHNAGYSHEDISPKNLVIGKTDPETIYLVDFGISLLQNHEPACLRSDLLSLGIKLIELYNRKCPDSWFMGSTGASWIQMFLQEVNGLCQGFLSCRGSLRRFLNPNSRKTPTTRV